MRRAAWILLAIALAAATATVLLRQDRDSSPGRAAGPLASGSVTAKPSEHAPAAHERARAVLASIAERGGAPLPGYVGGRAFNNRERRLPAGRYREYDVHPRVPGRDRGPERLVVEETTGRAYYTGDHYRTFVPLN